jgi:SAM-dependent methyltransferase
LPGRSRNSSALPHADWEEATTPLELVACPLCGGSRHKKLFERRDLTHHVTDQFFAIVRCRDCGFVFVNPRPSPTEIARYYPPEFYDVNVSPESLLEIKRDTLAARLALVGSLAPGRLLDIGCQKGEFMWVMRERGWDVQGLEFSPLAPNVFGLPIFHGTLEQAPFAPRSFDLITLWAVLEHVHDPVGMLRSVRRLLRPGGRAFVLVPNFNSIPGRFLRHDDVPRHLVMFTKQTLAAAAARADLQVVRYVFGDDIFSGSTRGALNYIWKLLHGESIDQVLEQNRSAERWIEFATHVRGKPTNAMQRVDDIDKKLTPVLDRVMNRLHLGFIMTAELVPATR